MTRRRAFKLKEKKRKDERERVDLFEIYVQKFFPDAR